MLQLIHEIYYFCICAVGLHSKPFNIGFRQERCIHVYYFINFKYFKIQVHVFGKVNINFPVKFIKFPWESPRKVLIKTQNMSTSVNVMPRVIFHIHSKRENFIQIKTRISRGCGKAYTFENTPFP
jgi:hypothetical protein